MREVDINVSMLGEINFREVLAQGPMMTSGRAERLNIIEKVDCVFVFLIRLNTEFVLKA